MKKANQVEYEQTPYYQDIQLANKEKWVNYFKLLYDDREVNQDRLIISAQDRLLKECGLSYDKEVEKLNGLDSAWNDLLNGFFRHYYSTLYSEYCMALLNYAGLIEAQFQPTKDHMDVGRKTDNLKKMAEVRQIINSLEKELYNNRHGSLGNVVTAKVMFLGTKVEANARQRTMNKKSLRNAAEDYD
jgi:hypothetical protein